MKIRVTFSVTTHMGSLTHVLDVPDMDNDNIKRLLNQELKAELHSGFPPSEVKDILLIVQL